MFKWKCQLLAGLVIFLALVGGAFAEPVVNEVMASNQATLADAQGEFDDWVEIYNPDGSYLDFPGQHPDISYGRVGEEFRYLINPTPGMMNDPTGVAVLEVFFTSGFL